MILLQGDSNKNSGHICETFLRCLQCKEVLISSTGKANDFVSEYLGTFKVASGIFMDGREVYMKDDGKFLNKDGLATFSIRLF